MRVFQFHSGSHPRDAVTNSMFLIAREFERLGVNGGVMAEHVHGELEGRLSRFDAARLAPDDLLLVHHSMQNGILDDVLAAPCRKLLVYHNITKPAFFAPGDPMRDAAITGYAQLWDIRGAVEGAVCDSAFNARALVERGFGNVETICLLGDFEALPERASLGRPWHHDDDVFHILFVGRICPNKGQHHLIRALPELQQALGREVRLTLCGHAEHGGAYLARLRHLMARLGVERNVVFAGSVPDEMLYGYYREADAYVSYSQHEGFGVPLIEAMAFGTPVFAYGCTAIPETLGGAGHVLHSHDPGELAQAMRAVFATRSSRRACIRAGRDRVRAVSIRQSFPRLCAFIEKTCGLRLPAPPPGGGDTGPRPARRLICEGPMDGYYSLSQVNRALCHAMRDSGRMAVTAIPREGTDAYRFDPGELACRPGLSDMLYADLDLSRPSVGLRNMYPPRVRGHVAVNCPILPNPNVSAARARACHRHAPALSVLGGKPPARAAGAADQCPVGRDRGADALLRKGVSRQRRDGADPHRGQRHGQPHRPAGPGRRGRAVRVPACLLGVEAQGDRGIAARLCPRLQRG